MTRVVVNRWSPFLTLLSSVRNSKLSGSKLRCIETRTYFSAKNLFPPPLGSGVSNLLQLLLFCPNNGDADVVSSRLDAITMSLPPLGVLLMYWMLIGRKERESLGSPAP